MFRFMKKAANQPIITMWNERGETIYNGGLTGLSFPDDQVVALSIKFFNDPEPCEIHRGAVISRALLELEAAIEPEKTVDIEVLGELGTYLSAYPGVQSVRLSFG